MEKKTSIRYKLFGIPATIDDFIDYTIKNGESEITIKIDKKEKEMPDIMSCTRKYFIELQNSKRKLKIVTSAEYIGRSGGMPEKDRIRFANKFTKAKEKIESRREHIKINLEEEIVEYHSIF